jgi:hypothetical protein
MNGNQSGGIKAEWNFSKLEGFSVIDLLGFSSQALLQD